MKNRDLIKLNEEAVFFWHIAESSMNVACINDFQYDPTSHQLLDELGW